ncbi:MAG: ATP-binding protein [Candidatus Magnetoovum sp. WYHC-5]|nr:ATP-binding protein [Candidatus Magnetoovum sp. WYHC-5]
MKKLKRFFVFLTVISALLFLFMFEYALFIKDNFSPKLVILLAFNGTLLILIIVIFFAIKNLARLYHENRKKVIGYRFKTKLVTIFVAVTFLPSAMLFIVSSGIVTNYIDKWFEPLLTKPLKDALMLGKNVYDLIKANTLEDAEKINQGIPIPAKYSIRRVDRAERETSESLRTAFGGEKTVELVTRNGRDFVVAFIPLYEKDEIYEVMLVETVVPIEITNGVGNINKAYNEYINLGEFKLPFKANYLIMLGALTFFTMALALWIALEISKSITIPIESLVGATKEVAKGNLNVMVQYERKDEIGLLINSFNAMVVKIKDTESSLQKAYKESDRRRLLLENIIANINSGIIYLDNNMCLLTINEAACDMLKTRAKDVINKHYKELTKTINSPQLTNFIKDINLYSFWSKEEQLKISLEGKSMVIRLFVILLKDGFNKPIGMLVVFDDVTDMILAEKALVWQEVAKRITHEIKNPLTPIKLSAQRLLKKWQMNDKNFDIIIEKATNTIVREVDGLKRLVDEFSKLGKMPDIQPKMSNLKHLINEVIELYSEYDKIAISINYSTFIEDIIIDADHIKRVLINIIDNAIQAIEENGKIQIVVKEWGNNRVLIEIMDNGRGIRVEDKERLFQPYFSRNKNGTGLGLAIAHRIIREHKGTITVSDNKPKGAVFSIELPCF